MACTASCQNSYTQQIWVGDQTLLYRAAKRRELEKSLDPPPLNQNVWRRSNISEPVVAFGSPDSTGELNVSVIVSPFLKTSRIEAFGNPEKVGEAIIRTITGSGQKPEVKGTLIKSSLREDSLTNAKYCGLVSELRPGPQCFCLLRSWS